jgi:hypothetical protein
MDTESADEVTNTSLIATHSNDSNPSLKWTTTRSELWSYYIYYIGNNGLSGFNFGPSQFQNLLFLAGYDPAFPPFSKPCGTGNCVLPYLGKVRDGMLPNAPESIIYQDLSFAVNAIVLLTNGISFAIQAAILLCIGSWADYGYWRFTRSNVLLFKPADANPGQISQSSSPF